MRNRYIQRVVTSFPEKTFEHWVSQYITYRYRTHLAQWWPPHGADVEVDPTMLPIGKAVWLELKTATPQARNPTIHDVTIDVPQLLKYHRSGTNPPVYYVIPHPRWAGTLGTASAQPWLAGTPRTELAFRRAGEKWFGNWTRVLPGWSLFAAVHRTGSAHQQTAKLGHWDGKTWTWGPAFEPPPGARHPEWSWREFWDRWQRCGDLDMPSALVLPDNVPSNSGNGGDVDRNVLVDRLSTYRTQSKDTSRELDYQARSLYLPRFTAELSTTRPTGRYARTRSMRGVETEGRPEVTSPDGTDASMLAMLSARELRV